MNKELVKIFYEIADILSADRVEFKPFAYRKAAQSIDDMKDDIGEIYARGGLKAVEEIPGIGKSIGQKIEEYVKTGKIADYEKLKRRLPIDWEELGAVAGLGPKRAKVLYQKLGIKDLADLEAAAIFGKIAALPGFGQKSQQNIIEGIKFAKQSRGRFLLGEILPVAQEIKSKLEKLPEVERVDIAGSLARRKETIGDIDFLAIIKSGLGESGIKNVMNYFTEINGVEKVLAKGDTKLSVRMSGGFNMDLRILPPESYGAALQYFTGSKEHNIALRRIAIEKGLKLSEYGLFKGSKMLPCGTEEEIYGQLCLEWVPPEIRENEGEIQAARAHKLPKLIEYGSLKGDLHCHSNWTDGQNSIEEIVTAAIDRGYDYVGIADHTKSLTVVHGLDEKQLAAHNKEIDGLNRSLKKKGIDFIILKGCEANIQNDGSIDIDDRALASLDFVIAGVHSNFKMNESEMTRRVVAAMENPNVDIISHPTGRLLKKREPYPINMEEIISAARRTGTILEINAQPLRLDLNDKNIRRALDYGVKMAINTDAHNIGHLRFAELGIAQARRGWAESKDIINTRSLGELKSFFLEKSGKKG